MKTIILFASALLFSSSLNAQTATPTEQRLREQVKSLTNRASTAETAQAALLAEKTELETGKKKIEKAFEDLTKQMDSDKKVAHEEAEKLKADIAAKEAELLKEKDLHVIADKFGKDADALARKTEAERARLAEEGIALRRIVVSQRTRNAKMLEISQDLLERYAKFGLGTALTAREPFVGITRARLESMIEEAGEKLAEQRIRMDGTTPKKPVAKP